MKISFFKIVFLLATILLFLLLYSCTTGKETVREEEPPVREEPAIKEDKPQKQKEAQEPPEPEEPETQLQPEEKIKVVPETKSEPEPEVIQEPLFPKKEEEKLTAEKEEYEVTEEIYKKTFEAIEELIQRLNSIIKSEDFETWLTYLTEDYKEKLNDQQFLKEVSEQPILKKYNIRLTSIRDYFTYVVVPSRSNARLDEIVFVDDTHVKAIMILNENPVILYQLEKKNGSWKIGIW
ncbi:MAG: hypothetical protein DRP87_17595 [Spirochaetes bacterium]|nr:MAG: hypothetical protein DRP87_17595 [Spirochaetota bacterium]